jgi:glycosyltransferase involved in cell wall biosynthesis
MRILYLSRETPLHPAGGIATYLEYMVPAMRAAGHEVFLFSWSEARPYVEPDDYAPFKPGNVHIEPVNAHEAWRVFPVGSRNLVMSHWLADRIAAKIREWDIDVVEATDYLAPGLTLFQQLQTRAGADRRLFVTYNHGFIEDFFEADQIMLGRDARTDHLCERQQCRISDLVIAPSRAVRDRLATYGITEAVETVREPYVFTSAPDDGFTRLRNEIEYIGRISISKGIDKLILLTNALHDVFPLRQVRLIGRIVNTPFRKADMRAYVTDRLTPELRDSLYFSGFLPRSAALQLLEPGAICPSLGSAETFSYACVESIDAGLVPVVRQGTPMAEFFPDHLQHHVLDGQMRSVRTLQRQMTAMLDNAAEVTREVRAHCRETLDPGRIAEQMGRLYEDRLARKRGRTLHAAPRKPATLADVTVLIPAYKPNHEFMETVDSLAWQTAGTPKVLICDDGTPESHQPWFDYARALLPDCRIVRQPNSGLLAARNTLAEACETGLALFLDTDDLFAPDLIEHLLQAWNSCPLAPDAVIPQRRNFGESAEPILQHLLQDHLHILDNDYRMTSLIRTQILRDIGFDATRRNGEGDDWVFWLEFTGRGHRGVLLPEQGFHYRFRKGSMSWPWSQGQHVGTQTMVREAMLDMCARNPAHVVSLARALYARNVTK